MLISIDDGILERFVRINEVKNSAKQSSPVASERTTKHSPGSLMTSGCELGRNSIGCCKMALLNSSVPLSSITCAAFL